MTDLYLDKTNHDLVLDGRDLRLTTEDEDVAQRLTIRLQFLLDEWFLDTSQGLPVTQLFIEAGKDDLSTIYSIIRTEVINIEVVPGADGSMGIREIPFPCCGHVTFTPGDDPIVLLRPFLSR